MIIRVKKTDIPSILFACGLRDIETIIVEDFDSSELVYVIFEITSPEVAWYVCKEVCERLRDEEDFQERSDNLFDLFKSVKF